MANFLSPILRPIGLDPSQGYDTAAAGAKDAQKQANALSDLQWQRQMGGLQQAQGYTGQLQDLYNSIYSPGGGQPAAGGMQAMAAQGAPGGSMLLPPPGPPTAPAGGNPGLSSLTKFSPAFNTGLNSPASPAIGGAVGGKPLEGLMSAIKGLF